MSEAELPPREVVTSSAFERDAKRLRKRGNDMARLFELVCFAERGLQGVAPPSHRPAQVARHYVDVRCTRMMRSGSMEVGSASHRLWASK